MSHIKYWTQGTMFLALLGLLLAGPAMAETSAPGTISYIEQTVAQIVQNDLMQLYGGVQVSEGCIQTADRAYCLAPGTPQERIDEFLQSLPTWSDDRYTIGGRWTITATDGVTGGYGNPVTITYSFLPDGTWIAQDGGSPSTLYAEMNGHFGSEAVWSHQAKGK